MKKILFILLISFHTVAFSQVGIGTQTPATSAMLEISSNAKGVLLSRMTTTERVAIASPIKGLMVFDTTTNSLWIHNGATWVNTAAEATYGDVKSGFQTTDHSGWIKLNGRAVSTLTATQKAAAASVGFTTNLPDATSVYLAQNNATLGSLSGSNTVALTQANLPVVNFTGTSGGGGNHNHTTDPAPINSGWAGSHAHTFSPTFSTVTAGWGIYGGQAGFTINGTTTTSTAPDHQHYIDIPSTSSSYPGDHFHSLSVSSGGSGAAINITPKTLSVNMFVYLGN